MKIDRDVERAVRKALAGAVAGEDERFDNAVEAIAQSGDAFSNKALDLVFAIDVAALFSIHDAQRPADDRIQFLAQEFTRQEKDWADIEEATTLTFLTSLADVKPPLEALSVADVFYTAFAVGGWLLSAFIPADAEWADFLDAILDKLQSEG